MSDVRLTNHELETLLRMYRVDPISEEETRRYQQLLTEKHRREAAVTLDEHNLTQYLRPGVRINRREITRVTLGREGEIYRVTLTYKNNSSTVHALPWILDKKETQ